MTESATPRRVRRCAVLRLQCMCRFRWVAIRVFFARVLHSIIAAVQWLVNAVVYRLDYARRFRCSLQGLLLHERAVCL